MNEYKVVRICAGSYLEVNGVWLKVNRNVYVVHHRYIFLRVPVSRWKQLQQDNGIPLTYDTLECVPKIYLQGE